MSEQLLLREIEIKRDKLNKQACKQPLLSEEVVRLSKELDHLLNIYDDHHCELKALSSAL